MNVDDSVNNLTSTAIDKPLSSAQGKVLQDGKVNKVAPARTLIPFNTGFSNNSGSYYCKTQEGIMIITANVTTSNPNFANADIIATLPTGYRPPYIIRIPGIYDSGAGGGINYGSVTISTNGNISLALSPTGNEKYLTFSVVFPTSSV